jgi:phosphate transport system substrate-binding protein
VVRPSKEISKVKVSRHGSFACLALVATLALSACGSDNEPSGSGASAGASGNGDCGSGTLNAAGSSAQKNAMDEWIKNYQQKCSGVTINYDPSGSGAGVTAFTSGTVDFAGSDSALKEGDETTKANARCSGGQAVDLPMVIGPIAVVYNVSGLDNLQLKPVTLAKIITGKIKKWDDPAIKADNSGATLPSKAIQTVHRSDSSGTVDNFTNFLSQTAPSDWTFGHDKTWKGPGGTGVKGSDGVANAIKQADGSIGFVEWSFAQNSSLKMAKVGNGAGEFTELTGEAAGKTIAGAKVTGTAPDLSMKIDYSTTEAGAYPVVLVTYEIACTKGLSADKAKLVKSFLTYVSSTEGQSALSDLGYAPLPDSVRTKVVDSINQIS